MVTPTTTAPRGLDALDLHNRVRATVGETHWPLVFDLLERNEADWSKNLTHDVYAMIEGIAGHFPGLAPAIRAVGQHIYETGDLPRACGVARDDDDPSPETPPCVGPVPVSSGQA